MEIFIDIPSKVNDIFLTDLEVIFNKSLSNHKNLIFIFDLTKLTNFPSLSKVFKLKHIIDFHRENIDKYLLYSKVLIINKSFKQFLDTVLIFLDPHKPIYFCETTSLNIQ
tara:strand:- start:1172 stop:1501 length:330 start_codon:yes stop_codon:yes gene_type:complete